MHTSGHLLNKTISLQRLTTRQTTGIEVERQSAAKRSLQDHPVKFLTRNINLGKVSTHILLLR